MNEDFRLKNKQFATELKAGLLNFKSGLYLRPVQGLYILQCFNVLGGLKMNFYGT